MLPTDEDPARHALLRRLKWTGVTLWGERLLQALWPVATVSGLYVAASLLGLWQQVHWTLHSASFLIYLVATGLMLVRALRHLRAPRTADIRRRAEAQAGLPHRPLDALDEVPHAGTGESRALWQAHLVRMRRMVASIRVPRPVIDLVRRDRFALRHLALLLLALGFLVAGDGWPARIAFGFRPAIGVAPGPLALDAWITPPDYVDEPPKMLDFASAGDTIRAVEGSRFTVRLAGARGRPRLVTPTTAIDMTADESGGYTAEAVLNDSGTLALRSGFHQAVAWPLIIRKDQPPEVHFRDLPGPTVRFALAIPYLLIDDFGVADVTLRMTRVGFPDRAAITLDLPGANNAADGVARTAYEDLTAHRWAGRSVRATLQATDHKGQTGTSDTLEFTLPERTFDHPVARRIIAARKQLILPHAKRLPVARRLTAIAREPESFGHDFVVFSALRAAYWRLKFDREARAIDEVIDVLWDAALHVEDGGLSAREEELRDSFDALTEALIGDADDDEINALMRELQRDLASLLSAGDPGASPSEAPPSGPLPEMGDRQFIDAATLQAVMQQIRDLAAAGDKQAALDLLNQLRNILENSRMASGDGLSDQALGALGEALDTLDDLRAAEENLQRRAGDAEENTDDLAAEQGRLQQQLEAIRDALAGAGIAPPRGSGSGDALGEAGQAMEAAEGALESNDRAGADKATGEAVQSLRHALRGLEDQLADALMQRFANSQNRDPLGRRMGGLWDNSVAIPDALDRERVRQILRTLRERAADTGRSKTERDYIHRLLERF